MKKVKTIITKMRKKYRDIKQKFSNYTKHNWHDTGTLLYWIVILLVSLCTGLMSGTFMRPVWAGVLLVTLLTGVVMIPALWLLKKIVRLMLRNGITELFCWLLLCLLCIFVMTGDSYAAGMEENAVFAVGFSLILALFFKSLWALIRHKVHTKTIFVTLVLTGIPVLAVTVLLGGGGFQDTYIERYLELRAENMDEKTVREAEGTVTEEKGKHFQSELTEQEQADFLEAMENGPFTVRAVTYGTSGTEDIASDTTSISRFAQNEDISGFFKERYQGYPLSETPMAGIVWYPEEADNCPTLFIIHGNHDWITDSYLGYEYLGTYLASHGYVVVSVDENACNGLSGENDGRAVLLLENIRQLKIFNGQKENPLYQKMDYEKLALAGHSRGGEAIATAYLFNDLEYYPDNGKRSFYYHFSINALIAIAPVYGQYLPSDRDVELMDVNYMVLHGANDQDVSTFMGMEQYENIRFTGEKDCIKTSLYIAGANHGQFNSEWGKYDWGEPVNRILNVENFISQQEQQQIAKIFIKAFLDAALDAAEGDTQEVNTEKLDEAEGKASDGAELAEILTDCEKYNKLLPETLYVQSYQTSDTLMLCDFEEDTRLETGSLEGVTIRAKNVDSWREEELTFSSGDFRGNYAAILKWEHEEDEKETEKEGEMEASGEENAPSHKAEITFSLPDMDLTDTSLQFDIMDMQEDFSEEAAELLEVEVIFMDKDGKEASVNAGDYAAMYPSFPVRLNKLQYIFGTAEYKHQFQTVSIPASDLKGVDLTGISRITLCFPQENGKAAIDNVGIAGEEQ